MGKKKRRIDVAAKAEEFKTTPFAALALDLPVVEKPPAPAAKPATERPRQSLSAADRELLREFSGELELPEGKRSLPALRLRMERKGRHGKTVTLVEGLDMIDEPGRMALLGDMRKALGVGGTFHDDQFLLQGDQRQRLGKWLEGRGHRVTGMPTT